MSWPHVCVLRFQAVTICCLFFPLLRVVTAFPSYGNIFFLGYNYWNTRYSLNYPSDWDGFWNDNNDGRTQYRRANSERRNDECSSGCSCSDIDKKVTCSAATSSLTVRNKIIQTLNPEDLSHVLTNIKIYNSGLNFINVTTFHKLTNLQTLKLPENSLRDFPDISKNVALEELDLYSNQIKLHSYNFTALPRELTRIILTENEIDWIPDNWFDLPKLEYIGLSKNKLKRFPDASFVNCKSLIYLGLDANEISSVSVTNLKPFYGNDSQLVHLNVSNNVISFISTGAFSGLIHLKVLELQVNMIKTIGANVFYEIPELLHLDLRGNQLQSITAQSFSSPFENLPKLQVLILMQQQTTVISVMFNAFKNLPALEDLWLSGNGLTNFPHPALSQESFPSLRYLHLEDNNINSLSSFSKSDFPPFYEDRHARQEIVHKAFEKIEGLQRLFLHRNRITDIQEEDLWQLSSLQQLYFSQNRLTNATVHPEAFRNLTSLRTLHLDYNNFHYVPLSVQGKSRLPQVQNLILNNNWITFIVGGTFSQLDTLLNLYLRNNKIVAVENEAFPRNIITLYMYNNKFKFKHENQFTNLSRLTNLHLGSNLIDVVPNTSFHGLSSLQSLYLGNNQICRILKVMFKDLTSLTTLDLSNNDIAFIEDGALSVVRTFYHLYLSNNQLTTLPLDGDFHNKQLYTLSLQNNRITAIPKGTFVNVTCSANCVNSVRYWDFTGNRISSIETGAFQNVKCYCRLRFTGNVLKHIGPHAFDDLNVCQIELNNMELTTLVSEAFRRVEISQDLRLYWNKIATFEENPFLSVTVGSTLGLQNNAIQAITGKLFGDSQTSSINNLELSNNQIQSIHDDAFKGVTRISYVYLTNNNLTVFPSKPLKNPNPFELYLQNNQIAFIAPGGLETFTNLQYLYLQQNQITHLRTNLFQKQTRLERLDLTNNLISVVESGAFNNLLSIMYIYLQGNQIVFLPTFPRLTSLRTLDLGNNRIANIGQDCFGGLVDPDGRTSLSSLDFSGNQLACDCNVYSSLVSVISALSSSQAAECVLPPRVASVKFFPGGSYENHPVQDFTCSPVSVSASAPGDFQLRVSWDRAAVLYPPYVLDAQDPNGTYANTFDITNVTSISYNVTCISADAPSLIAVTQNEFFLFQQADGVRAGIDYTCHVTMTVTAYNGTNLPNDEGGLGSIETQTSPISEKVSITTLEAKAVTNTSGNASNYYIDITYYDFQSSDIDFTGIGAFSNTTFRDPQYIHSPYGSWLAISDSPTSDSFSQWFRSVSVRNIHYEEKLELPKLLETDSKGNPVFRHFNDKFFPVDGRGFGSEGQRDCYTNALRNYGFTAAIRTAFNFTGEENFAFSGGEELWVFIDKKLVVQILSDPLLTDNYPCRSLSLADAAGSGSIIPNGGVVVGGKCQVTGSLSSEAVSLSLMKNVEYYLEVFIAERYPCNSHILFQSSGVSFVVDDFRPGAYITVTNESVHIGSILQVFNVGDPFSSGPYTVEILKGNEQDRFDVMSGSYSAASPPSTSPVTFILDGETILLCPNATDNPVTPIPTIPPGIQSFPSVTTSTATLTLKALLDYEATKNYMLYLRITDNTEAWTGNITIKIIVDDVNDNCPILQDVNITLDLEPIPPLRSASFFTAVASDKDDGVNAQIQYKASSPLERIPTIKATKFYVENGSKVVWSNKTIKWTYKYQIFAVDGGSPKRGDSIPLTITFDVSCETTGAIVADAQTGDVFFRAPGLTGSIYPLNSTTKPRCRGCTTGFFCPGDGTEKRCGEASPTEFSFGAAANCSSCPEGWLCKNGTALPCPASTYVKCNETWCPEKCFDCEPGTVCFEGMKQDCTPGRYSDGKGFPCDLCPPGSFNNQSRAETCQCCADGYTSTSMKTSCQPCLAGQWARHGSFPNCSLCQTCNSPDDCPCLSESTCFPGVSCLNVGIGQSQCGPCPSGYEGNGRTCDDIDECTRANPCYDSDKCENLVPGYQCAACPAGYRGNAPSGVGLEDAQNSTQVCEEIDECKEGISTCDPNAQCINTDGSFLCGACHPGFTGNGYTGCFPGDLCTNGSHTCDKNAQCTSTGTALFKCTCNHGFGGDGEECEVDSDLDGIPSIGLSCTLPNCKKDNCPSVPNTGQEDTDDDTDGDSCDVDDDNDVIPDLEDNCQFVKNQDQADTDGDGVGDACDNCKAKANVDQRDSDGNGIGDACEIGDLDDDGISGSSDNCPTVSNPDQADNDTDGVGDACDNCPKTPNSNQVATYDSGFGDACFAGPGTDKDGDGVPDAYDNCVDLPNGDQADADVDSVGDACDEDQDGDGVSNLVDNCRLVNNSGQEHVELFYDPKANPIGDACISDFDGDGVPDNFDHCPNVKHLNKTSFTDHFTVDLYPGHSDPVPVWRVAKNGIDVEEVTNVSSQHPSMLIGSVRYGPVDYSGVLFVKGAEGSDYVGVVFGYQSNRKFYVVMWRKESINFRESNIQAGLKGLQLKLVDSNEGPGLNLAEALWHSGDTANKVKLLWCDPKMEGWKFQTPYAFHITHRPSTGLIRVQVKQYQKVLADTGDLYDTTITGGRLGMMVFGQQDVIWSRLEARCSDRTNKALQFDGADDHVLLPSIHKLGLTDSFTISAWVWMSADYPDDAMPIVCSLDATLCLYLKNRQIHGNLGSYVAEGSEVIEPEEWHHLVYRYDAQTYSLELFVNGSSIGKHSNVLPHTWDTDIALYVGRDSVNYMKGTVDELTLWGVRVEDSEIVKYMKTAGLLLPIHKGVVRAYFNMEDTSGTIILDQAGNNYHGNLVGGPSVVSSSVDKNRFMITYPNNKRKKRSAWSWIRHSEL